MANQSKVCLILNQNQMRALFGTINQAYAFSELDASLNQLVFKLDLLRKEEINIPIHFVDVHDSAL